MITYTGVKGEKVPTNPVCSACRNSNITQLSKKQIDILKKKRAELNKEYNLRLFIGIPIAVIVFITLSFYIGFLLSLIIVAVLIKLIIGSYSDFKKKVDDVEFKLAAVEK